MGDVLVKLNSVIDWESFRPRLEAAIPRKDRSSGGRPPYDVLLMFKCLVIKRLYNLSYDQTEIQINDRLTFMRFLGLSIGETVPDANTMWNFAEQLAGSDAYSDIFDMFNTALEQRGLITRNGSIVDATFIEAPKRKNTREQREALKRGETPEEWSDPARPQLIRQRDTDATWTKKGSLAYFGYKASVKVDADSKLILDCNVNTACDSDLLAATGLVGSSDRVVYADAAYPGMELPEGVENQISERAYRGRELTGEQKLNNHRKAKVRCRVEHVFAGIVRMVGGTTTRCKNAVRATLDIALMCLVYNMRRAFFLLAFPKQGTTLPFSL